MCGVDEKSARWPTSPLIEIMRQHQQRRDDRFLEGWRAGHYRPVVVNPGLPTEVVVYWEVSPCSG